MKPLLAAVATLALTTSTFATDLRKESPACWEARFREGTLGCQPHGVTRGTVLSADGKLPRLTARAQGTIWKGKTFHDDGTFTNRWLGGVRAGGTCIRVEPSWIDGRDCFVMQYPPSALVFGNVRDELREIEPGVWLGRSFDAVTGQPKNWFVLRSK